MVSTGSTGGGMVSTGSDSGGGLGRGPLIGGGIGVTLIVALIGYFLGGRGEGGGDIVSQVLEPVLTSSNVIQSGGEDTGFVGVCTAAQANSDANCQLSATADSLDTFWGATLPAEVGIRYEQPDIVSFDGTTRTACGTANTSAGPFYCPGDKAIYIDTAFYQDLVSQFGGSEGPLAREYILAHEFGHAIQHQLGVLDHDHSVTGAESASVRTELQADCFAGIWAKAASSTVDPDTGVVFLNPLSEQDVSDAISAASSVGDDHIQQMSRGTVDPDSFTHGSSAQRVAWFMQGYQHGTVASCDTFAASNLG
jgi:predicted metalloprotease